VVSVGDIIDVVVLDVDLRRNRIALSRKSEKQTGEQK
jgi:transcriptional accessory protein Tex/SPT6